ncbi:MAG: hypothetical protein D6702_08510 [Planctomycetota bacterium]|nr:MAG: hypothetical protein D6702_08510 [Planctomycetota bacterium]
MSPVGGALLTLTAWLTGRAVLPGRRQLPRSPLEEQATAYLAGCALLVTAASLGLLAGLPLSSPFGALLPAAGAAAGILRLRRDHAEPLEEEAVRGPALLLMTALGLGSAALTLAWPLNEFDPILHFAFKGRLLAAGELPSGEAFRGVTGSVGRVMTHPNYPLGIPILEALSARLGGGWEDRWIQVPLAFWSAALPWVLALGLRDSGRPAAAAAAWIAAATPALYVRGFLADGTAAFAAAGLGEEKMLGGRGDLPVMALFGAGCALTLAAWRRRNAAPAAVGGLCLAGAAQMKNEGLALLGVLALALGLGLLLDRARALRPAAAALTVAALAAVPWLAIRAGLPAIDENYGARITWSEVVRNLTQEETAEASPIRPENYGSDWTDSSRLRPVRIVRYFGREFADPLSWGLLWPLALFGLAGARRRPELRWLALTLLGAVALYALVLLVTPWFLPALHKKGIPARLLVHLVGPAALLIGARFGRDRSRPAAG